MGLKPLSAILVAAGLATIAHGLAVAQPAPAPATPQPTGAAASPDQNYILGPSDVVEIQVLGRADFTTRARIDQDGTIQLPYLGAVNAAHKTTAELSDQIKKALETGGYFSNPILSIEIVGFASRYVTVLGDVGAPGLIPVDRPYRLSEILARVGGGREDAADYVVVRSEKGAERHLSVKTLATGDEALDPYVSPGDKIFSPKADLIYVSGQVKTPGVFPLETGMTLRMAIARGGGVTDLGTDHRVKVTGPDGKPLKIGLDEKVGAGDVIVVGERLF